MTDNSPSSGARNAAFDWATLYRQPAPIIPLARALDDFARQAVERERTRCLRILDMNNDNDAHRYYIKNPIITAKNPVITGKAEPIPQRPGADDERFAVAPNRGRDGMTQLIHGVLFFVLGYAAFRCAALAWTLYRLPPWEWEKCEGIGNDQPTGDTDVTRIYMPSLWRF